MNIKIVSGGESLTANIQNEIIPIFVHCLNLLSSLAGMNREAFSPCIDLVHS